MQVEKSVTTNGLHAVCDRSEGVTGSTARLQHHFQGGQTPHAHGHAAGQLTGSAVVSASTLKVCCSMKKEISNPQHCLTEAPSAHMVIRRRMCACAGTKRQSSTLLKCPKSEATSLWLDPPSPLWLSSPTPPPTPPSWSLSTLPALPLRSPPPLSLLFLPHSCNFYSTHAVVGWDAHGMAREGDPLLIKKKNARPRTKPGLSSTCSPLL